MLNPSLVQDDRFIQPHNMAGLSADEISRLLLELTLEGKISLLSGKNMWETTNIDRLNIPSLKTTDGPAGVRGAKWNGGSRTTFIPCGISLAATFDPTLIEKVGAVLGKEARLKRCSVLLAPTMNMSRSPLGGRNFENYGEDPYLTGCMAKAMITGIQSQNVGACMKHYVANDSETRRYNMDQQIDTRTLREIYLRPFRIALEANPWTVMTSYPKINGTHVDASTALIRDILRNEWGFHGLVMSDWGGLNDTVQSLLATIDLEMPGPPIRRGQALLRAIESGDVDEVAHIDPCVRRVLELLNRAKLPSSPSQSPSSQPLLQGSTSEIEQDDESLKSIAREAAIGGLVLLKNNGVLPIQAKSLKTMAIIGPHAKKPTAGGSGSASVNPYYVSTPYDSITAALEKEAPDLRVVYQPGMLSSRVPPTLRSPVCSLQPPTNSFRMDFYAGHYFEGEIVGTSYWNDSNMYLMSDGDVPQSLAGKPYCYRITGIVRPTCSGSHTWGLINTGKAKLYVDDELVIDNSYWKDPSGAFMGCGSREKQAQMNMVKGQSYWLRVDNVAAAPPLKPYDNTLFDKVSGIRIGLLPPSNENEMMEEAIAAAKAADLTLMIVGLDADEEKEGGDRPNMKMAAKQLIKDITAVSPNVIVVVQSACAVEMPWVDDAAAIVQAWYQGQENGNALAETLLGLQNFSGKLPVTFPKRIEDHGSYPHFPGDAENDRSEYGEGVLVGYRHFQKHGIQPLWPFGFGLSYTRFELSNAQVTGIVSKSQGSCAVVAVDVTNVGQYDGHEVVQVYIAPSQRIEALGQVSYPKSLAGFAKVFVPVGETRRASISLSHEVVQWYYVEDTDDQCKEFCNGQWRIDEGSYRCEIGNSSDHLSMELHVRVEQ